MSIKRIIIPQAELENKNINLVSYVSSATRANFEVFLTENAIVYILSGKKEITFSNQIYHIGKGELFLLPKGEYLMSEYVTDDEDFESVTFYFNSKVSQKALSEIEINNDMYLSYSSKENYSKTISIFPATSDIENVFKTLVSYIEKDVAFKQQLIELKFIELILMLLNNKTSQKVIMFLSSAIKVEKPDIPTIVSEYLHKSITIDKLAMLSGRSISQFKRDFSILYGTSPHKWFVKRKFEHAIFLLKTSDKNIEQISEACGFANPTHFSRIFKKEFGIAPSKYLSKQSES